MPGSRTPAGLNTSPSTTEKPSPRSTTCAATRASFRPWSPRMGSPTLRSLRRRCQVTRSSLSISRDGATRTCTPSRKSRESSFERPARNAPQRRSVRLRRPRHRGERGCHRRRPSVRPRQGLRERLGPPERGRLSRLQPALDRRRDSEAQAQRQPLRFSDLAAQSGSLQLSEDALDDGERDRLGPESAEHGRQHAKILLRPRHDRPVRALEGLLFRRSEEHTSELQSRPHLVCRLLLEKKKKTVKNVCEWKNSRHPPGQDERDRLNEPKVARIRTALLGTRR